MFPVITLRRNGELYLATPIFLVDKMPHVHLHFLTQMLLIVLLFSPLPVCGGGQRWPSPDRREEGCGGTSGPRTSPVR